MKIVLPNYSTILEYVFHMYLITFNIVLYNVITQLSLLLINVITLDNILNQMDAQLQDPIAEKRTEILTRLAAILAPSLSRIKPDSSAVKNNKRNKIG